MAEATYRDNLKRLFGGQVIIRRKGGRKLKVIDTNQLQSKSAKNYLDRYSRLYSSMAGSTGKAMQFYQAGQRMALFKDYEQMDSDAIIASALDIYADECLTGDTTVPLLDGRKLTLKEMFDSQMENFWLYGIDINGNFKPSMGRFVAYKGKSEVYKLTLEDGTILKSTGNHRWLDSNNKLKVTENLKVGDGIYALATKLSTHKNMPDYEMIEVDGKFKFVHREVARHTPALVTDMRQQILEFDKNPKRNFNVLCDTIGTSKVVFNHLLTETGYTSFSEYVDTSNHKIISIEKLPEEDVYDIIDVDGTNLYALEANDGSKLYTHNSTLKSEYGDVLTIISDTEEVKEILHNLYYDIMNIEFNLWPWVRNLCKYGDFFLHMMLKDKYGIFNVIPMSVYDVVRLEGVDPERPNEVTFQLGQGETLGTIKGENVEQLQEYEVAHFRLNSDSNYLPYGKCLTGDTHIDTEFGSKYLKDITIGEKIWTFNSELNVFELSNVINKVESGKKNLLKISSQHNFIKTSETHPILTLNVNDKKYEYKKASEIQLGDLLIISNNKHIQSIDNIPINKELDGFNKNGWKNSISNVPAYIDEEFAELMGFMIGDGWLNKDCNRVNFAMGIYDVENDRYINLLQKYSGKIGRILKRKNGSNQQFYVDSKSLAHVLYNNGLIGKAKSKRIPTWVFESNTKIQHAFIVGLQTADGWDNTDKWNVKRYSIQLCNKDLIYDFKRLIQLHNIKTSIPLEDDIEKNIVICDIPCISHGRYSFNYYLDGNKKKQLKKYNYVDTDNVLVDAVKRIEIIDADETYDIQVDSYNSNFIANGIVVHNSMIEGARKVWKQLTLMEDAMLIHRIMRAPEKRIFKVDIGSLSPAEVEPYMKVMMSKMKKTPIIDQQTGDYNLRFNMQNMTEDFFLPVRGGDSGTEIDTLQGMSYEMTEDIEYLKNKMLAALKVPKAFLGYDDQLNCIVPKTKIPLLNGEVKDIYELISDYENGIKNYVYSLDTETNLIVPGEISWAGFTRKDASLVRVHLDNDNYIDCTPDHKFLTRGGNWIEAQYLEADQSLMPLYLKKTEHKQINGYTSVYHPATELYQPVHRLVAEHYNLVKRGSGKVVHHKDYDKLNNYPENFDCSMNWVEHRGFHTDHIFETMNSPENLKARSVNPSWRKSVIENGRKGGLVAGKKLGEWVKENGSWNKGHVNGLDKKCPMCGIEFYTYISVNKECCSNECESTYWTADKKYNTKYIVDYDTLLEVANISTSLKDLSNRLDIKDRATLNKVFEYHNINKVEFIFNDMPEALKNKHFMQNYRKYEPQYLNHTVNYVEILTETCDTCDITIDKYHNFATDAGVIIHNSKATLAAEDVRFARTIERIQRTIVSELKKIGVVHLYTQGYHDDSLLFDLELTNPSTIYEEEKIELLVNKISAASSALADNLLPTEWLYNNIFKFSKEEKIDIRLQTLQDKKRQFRWQQIEDEGNDPVKSGEAIGTQGSMMDQEDNSNRDTHSFQEEGEEIPKGGWPGSGRPKEGPKYGKDSSINGRDPLGKHDLKKATSGSPKYGKSLKLSHYDSLVAQLGKKFVDSNKEILAESEEIENEYKDDIITENDTKE